MTPEGGGHEDDEERKGTEKPHAFLLRSGLRLSSEGPMPVALNFTPPARWTMLSRRWRGSGIFAAF
jgi:hypothetical protein